MNYHTKEELVEALRVVSSSIINCGKGQKKFSEDISSYMF